MTGEVGLGDEQWWEAITYGPPATIGTYRWAYQVAGVPWPGDAEARRRHPIVEGPNTEPDAAPPTVVQLDWPQPPPNPQPQPTAGQRLAEALGWQQVPEFSEQEQRELDEQFEAAQAEARRIYGIDNDSEATTIPERLVHLIGRQRRRRRLLAALGWGQAPELSAAEQAQLDAATAQAEAHRIDGIDGIGGESEATAHRQGEALRGEVTWLCRAVQALLDHHHICLDPPHDWREREERALRRLVEAAGRPPSEAERAKVAEIVTAAEQWRTRTSAGGFERGYDTAIDLAEEILRNTTSVEQARQQLLHRRAATPLDQAIPHEQAIDLVANTTSTPAEPTTPDLVRGPGHWRDEHGHEPNQMLHITQTGPRLAGTAPGWATVTGWRHHHNQPHPQWVRVQIRTHYPDPEETT